MRCARLLRAAALCGALALLAGCAGTRVVESDVDSYSTLTALPEPPTYRIEPLPSQQARAAAFAPIQALAEQALARAGLRRDDASPRLLAQLGAEGGYSAPDYWPYYPPPLPGRFGWGYGRRWGWGGGWMMDSPPPLYRRSVTLVLRDAATRQVVYETSAAFEDVWTDDPAIYDVLFDQALSGFPQPPQGRRTLRTPMPQPQPAPATAAPQAAH